MLDSFISEMLAEYFELSDEEGIEVLPANLPDSKSCSMRSLNGKCFIGIDMSQIGSSAELRSCLAHELGHCRTGSFYDAGVSSFDRSDAEYKAVRWAVLFCVPFAAYIDAIRDGVRDIWQLSERFDITVASAKKVAEFYESRVLDYVRMAKEVIV